MTATAVLALWVALTDTGTATATQPAIAPPAVVVRVRPETAMEDACLRPAVVGFLASHGINASWPEKGAPGATAAVSMRTLNVDVELAQPTRARLTLTDSAGGPPRTREITLTHGLDGVGCEALADVIESAVLTMAAEPPPPPAAPAQRPLPEGRADTDIDAAFGARPLTVGIAGTLAPTAWNIVQPGLELTASPERRPGRTRTWFRIAYALPVTVAVDGASIRWQTLAPLSLGFSTASHGRRLWIESTMWLGLDLVFVQRQRLTGAGPATSDTAVEPYGHLEWDLTFGARVAEHAAVFASVRLGFLGPAVRLQSNDQTLFQSWWLLRPAFVLGGRWL